MKKPWFSKTIWLGLFTGVAPFIPGGAEFISANLATVGIVWGLLSTVLRFVTKDKIQLGE